MSPLRLILASLLYHWRSNLAVACGVAVGTAVLTGALLVGDSMRGSLRQLTLDRLGRIEETLLSGHFFRAELADEIAPSDNSAAPAILLRVSLENPNPDSSLRANRVELLGCDERFWQLGSGRPKRLPQPHEIVLNRAVADLLSVRPGDAVLVRFPRPGAIPADSALGIKRETVRMERLRVSEIIPDEGSGRFGLQPSQQTPRNAFVPLEWLQQQLDRPGRANAILCAGSPRALRPELTDFGLNVEHIHL